MARNYWLDVFTVETWDEFRRHGGNISGFPKTPTNTVRWKTIYPATVGPPRPLQCFARGSGPLSFVRKMAVCIY